MTVAADPPDGAPDAGPSETDASGATRVVVDARGLRCPLPVIRAAAAARDLPAGSVLEVRWTDPAARHDVPAWARMRGHEVLGTERLGDDAWATAVRTGPPPTAARA